MEEIRILVTGAGGAPAANFINSLRLVKDKKFYIVGTDVNRYHLELSTEADTNYVSVPVNDPEYFNLMNRILEKEKIQFLHCQTEQEVAYWSVNKDRIKAKTLIPPKEILEVINNKDRLNALCGELGISVPRAFHLSDKSSLAESLDVLLRDDKKVWLRATCGAGSRASLPVSNFKQADGWIDYWTTQKGLMYKDFMVSEFLPGKEFAFQSIWYKGELITSMVRERVEYLFGNLFPSGHSSSPSVAKTVHRDDVNDVATKAIKAADPNATGIFCADIKENKKGEPCLMEINVGRFFTTSNNFSHAGLNMPYYYVLLGMDKEKELPKLPQYNGIPAGWYWIRSMDMGYKLVKGEKWTSKQI